MSREPRRSASKPAWARIMATMLAVGMTAVLLALAFFIFAWASALIGCG